MLRERTINRFRFECPHCGHRWSVDYDVTHVDDRHGLTLDCYSLHEQPVTAPVARGVVRCPRCDASPVHVELMSTRDAPPIPPLGAPGGRPPVSDPDHPAARNR